MAKARSSLPVSIRDEIEQVVDDGDHAFAGGADVLHVFDVTLVAERAEPFADHHFGKADDGVERRADLVADPRQHVGLGVGRAIGQPPRLLQFALAFSDLRKIAKHREEIRAVGPGASHGHRQRDQAAPAHAAQHVAAVIEQAGDAGALDALQIIPDHALAFRREQFGEIALHEFGAVIAEQRLGAAVARIDVALGVEHHDAFGRGVEDGAEFLGIGVADGRRSPMLGSPPISRWRRLRLAPARPRRSAPARNRRPMKSCRGARRSPTAAHVPARPGWRKSSPACRCPMCCWRSRRRARHRARRGRRLPPAREGSDSPSARETPGWHRAAGRADRSARRPGADRAASCRAGLSPRAGGSGCASQSGLFAEPRGFRRGRQAVGGIGASDVAGVAAAAPFSLSSRADNCRASSLKALFSTGVRTGDFGSPMGRNGRTFLGVSWAFPRLFPNRFGVKSQ